MLVTIDKSVLSSPSHLFYDSEKEQYGWSEKIEDDSYVITNRDNIPNDINEVCRLYELQEIFPDFGVFKKAYNKLTSSSVPWYHTIPRPTLLQIVKDTFKKSSFIESLSRDERYIKTFLEERSFLCSLHEPHVDLSRLASYIESETVPAIKGVLESFLGEGGVCDQVVYSQTSTATGRLVVKSGPRVLVLPKRSRDIFKSRFDGGVILEIDFVALEPTVLANVQGIDIGDDIYTTISEKALGGGLSRQLSKHVILSSLYGASEDKVMSMVPDSSVSRESIRQVKDFFKVNELIKRLTDESSRTGSMFNFFGRRIKKAEGHKVISHFLQSTAVDVALLGFSMITKDVGLSGSVPLFVVHDALVMDVSPECMPDVLSRVEKGIDLGDLGRFSLKAQPFHTP